MRQQHRERRRFWDLMRLVLPVSVVTAFLLFMLTASIVNETKQRVGPDVDFPDFSHYKILQTLPLTHFPIRTSHTLPLETSGGFNTNPDSDDSRRVVAIGDIHAMNQSLSKLLAQISYDPQSDTLIHLGDLVSKSKKVSSDAVLDFMSTNRILGIRGNNDEKVIEWRAWMEWIVSFPGGREWLEDMDSHWSHIDGDEPNAEFSAWLKKKYRKWQAYVPSGWKLQGKHYKIARDISQEHYNYLRSLPLVLYSPTAHTYFVHAGLLAADPTHKLSDPKQPLSHWPTTANPDDHLALRGLQELALLNEVPQNQDPWVLMNMRSLSKHGKVKSGLKGIPWSDLWNDVMNDCSGLPAMGSSTTLSKHGLTTHTPLHCFPSTVIYGHAAARDLDVKRWSVGIDTGCTYDRRLTAVILDGKSLLPQSHTTSFDASLQDFLIPYGDGGTARVINVKCHA